MAGPFDGARLSTRLELPCFWTNGKRCYRAPGKGRELYRAMGEAAMGRASRFRYIGHTHELCGCGVVRKKVGPCPMCGARAVTNRA